MKRSIFFLLALVAMTGLAKNVVVERPAFRSLMKNFNYRADIWPVKVELTKHATVVHFHVARAARSSWSTDGGWLEVDGTMALKSLQMMTLNWARTTRGTRSKTPLSSISSRFRKAQRRSITLVETPRMHGLSMASDWIRNSTLNCFLLTRKGRMTVSHWSRWL